jgi:hypothetical protein
MIADEIKKAGQATIDQCVTDLVTYKLTDTWTTFSGLESELGALACNTGGNYQFDGDFSEYKINFTQDVCRYNGTPVKTLRCDDHGHGDYSTYEVIDFSNNQLYYDEHWPSGTFTVRQIEFQNNKQSFQILDSGRPSYIDSYDERPSYSETGLLNTISVPLKESCSSSYTRYLKSVTNGGYKKIASIVSGSKCVMVMINVVQSDNYDWTAATHPDARCDLNVKIQKVNTSTVLTERMVGFNYYNPGNMMIILQRGQVAEVTVSVSQTTKVLCTIQETAI